MGTALSRNHWDAAFVGISLSEGQYYGQYDHSYYKDDYTLFTSEQFQPNGESAVVAMAERHDKEGEYYCMVSFRGRDLDDVTLEYFASESSTNNVFDDYEDNLRDIRDSDFATTVADDGNPSVSCNNMNDNLMSKFSSFDTIDLEGSIMTCLNDCDSF